MPDNFLAQCVRAVLPVEVSDFWLSRLNPAWSTREARATVVASRPLTADSVTLVLRPNRLFSGFQAGQHVSVGLEIDGIRQVRSYSPMPLRVPVGRDFAITVRRQPGGRVTNRLCDGQRIGTVVTLSAAYGDLLPDGLVDGTCLLAAGSGITPFMSLLRDAARRGHQPRVHLHYWVTECALAAHHDELLALAATWPDFTLTVHETRVHGVPAGSRRLTAAHLAGSDWQQVLAVGPHGFVTQAQQLCADAGLAFRGECFSLPALQPDGAPVQVTLRQRRQVVTVSAGQPLLQALEAQGVSLSSGCRQGICNTCACRKLSGATTDLRTGDGHAGEAPALRLCVSRADSDLDLDL